MVRKLRWGILGCGSIAETFARELPFSVTGKLVAVGSRASRTADAFCARHAGCRAYGSYEELLADQDVEAVYISTPHPFHAEWAIRAAGAGKHVLCEKPLAMNTSEVAEIIQAARDKGTFLMEAFMYKCHPQTLRVAELIRAGHIGKIRFIEAAFSFSAGAEANSRLFDPKLGGGSILDVGCYTMSVCRFLAGAAIGQAYADPVSVNGTWVPVPSGVDGLAAASLLFPSGILGQLQCGTGLTRPQDLLVWGDLGHIRIPQFWNPPTKIEIHLGNNVTTEQDLGPTKKYAWQADHVEECLPNQQSPILPWGDSLGNAKALDAWLACRKA